MANSGKNKDDLTRIKGIGSAKQKWFQTAFAVTTFQALSRLNADEIEAQLKREKKILRPKEIRYWLEEATRLAEAEAVSNAQTAESVSLDDWQTIASFVVDVEQNQAQQFQTTVQHLEADQNQTWPGIEQKRLCVWIAAQVERVGAEAGVKTGRPKLKIPLGKKKPSKPPLEIVVRQVEIEQTNNPLQPVTTVYDGRPLTGILRQGTPFSIETWLDVEQTDRPNEKLRVKYQVKNLRTGNKWGLVDAVSIKDEEGESQVARIDGIKLPQGQFRLQADVESAGILVSNVVDIPFLQVI